MTKKEWTKTLSTMFNYPDDFAMESNGRMISTMEVCSARKQPNMLSKRAE